MESLPGTATGFAFVTRYCGNVIHGGLHNTHAYSNGPLACKQWNFNEFLN